MASTDVVQSRVARGMKNVQVHRTKPEYTFFETRKYGGPLVIQ